MDTTSTTETQGPQGKGSRYVGVAGGAVREAGASVWWDRGQGVARGVLAAAWEAAGLDAGLLPPEKGLEAALHEAVDALQTRTRFVRRAPGGVGWLVVEERHAAAETAPMEGWRGVPSAHAYLDAVGRLRVDWRGGSATTPAEVRLEADLRAGYARCATDLDGGEVTGWVASLLVGLRAVSLRETGGLVFVPAPALPAWRRMADVITACTRTQVQEMATVFLGDDAARTVGTILGAVRREGEEAVARITRDLAGADARGKPLGARALATREAACRELAAKVGSYEDLLGAALPELQGQVEALRAACAVASMVRAAELAPAGQGGLL